MLRPAQDCAETGLNHLIDGITIVNEKIRAAAHTTGFIITDHQHHVLREVANTLYVMTAGTQRALQHLGYLPAGDSR